MKVVPVNQLFEIAPKTASFAKADLQDVESSGMLPAISTSKNLNGICGFLPKTSGSFAAGSCITIPCNGNIIHAFYQPSAFFCGSDTAALTPKWNASKAELCFYVLCFRTQRFRFNFGKKLQRTELLELKIPALDEIPDWVYNQQDFLEKTRNNILKRNRRLRELFHADRQYSSRSAAHIRISELFSDRKGDGVSPKLLETHETTGIPFVSASAKNNGVVAWVSQPTSLCTLFPGPAITVPNNINACHATLQLADFYCGDNSTILYPKEGYSFSPLELLFYVMCIRKQQFRFSYGRKARKEGVIAELLVPSEIPDWVHQQSDFFQLQQEAIKQKTEEFALTL